MRRVCWDWRLCASRAAALLSGEDMVKRRVDEATMSRAIQVRFALFHDGIYSPRLVQCDAGVKCSIFSALSPD